MKYYMLSAAFVLVLGACGGDKVEQEEIDVPAMRASSILQRDSIRNYTALYGEANKDFAAGFAAKAKELRKTNTTKAIWNAKRAVTLHPVRENYLLLAELLLEAGKYQDAFDVYNLVVFSSPVQQADGSFKDEFFFAPPDKEDMYKGLFAELQTEYAMMEVQYYIEDLLEHGWTREELRDRLLADKELRLQDNQEAMADLKLYFMTEDEIKAFQNSPENFQVFLRSFTDTSRAFSLNQEQLIKFDYTAGREEMSPDAQWYKGLASYFIFERRKNPGTWVNFNTKYRRKMPNGLWALIYAVDSSATGCPPNMRHLYYRLMVCKPDGSLVTEQVVAWQNGETIGTLEWPENANLRIVTYRRQWKKPYRFGEFDNEETGSPVQTSCSDLAINEEGGLEQAMCLNYLVQVSAASTEN